MKLRIISYLSSKFRIRSTTTTNLKTGKTSHSITPKTGIRRFRFPRISTSKTIKMGGGTRYTVTTHPRRGTRIKTSFSVGPRTRVVYSYKTPRVPRVRTSGTRIKTPRIKSSYSYRTPKVRVRTGIRRSYTSTPRIRTPRVRVRSSGYRVRRRY